MNFDKELEQIAKQYEDEGYVVSTHPNNLPGFASDSEPDLLAVRGGESVLIQVKKNRADVAADPKISGRAEAINSQKGWRYDLIVLEPYSMLSKTARTSGEPTVEEIKNMIEEAEALLHVVPLPEEVRLRSPGIDKAVLRGAFLQAWAALEAAMRHVAQTDEPGRNTDLEPTVLIRQLYASGRISPAQYHLIEANRQARNSIIHGFGPVSLHPNQPQSIVELARELLAQIENPEPV